MHHKINRLVFDVGEGGVFQALHHMGRHPEDAADFLHAELPGGKELAVLRRQGDRLVSHPFFKYRNPVCVVGTAVYRSPVIPDLLRVF